jgi:two-component system, NarL family, sensor histidine kinase UhpB
MIEAERSSRVQEPDSAPVTQPGWRVPSYHDRGDFSLPDWCDERWSKPTPSDPGGARFSALRTELTRRRFRVPRSGRCTGESSARRTSSVCPLPRRGEWGLPPISARGHARFHEQVRSGERALEQMKVASPPLYVKVCLINGAVFAAALALLVVSPATVSHQVTAPELAVLVAGLAVIVATNAALLHGTLAPLDRLVQLLDTFEASEPGRRFPSRGGGVAARLAQSFNDLLDRLDAERATRNVRELAVQEAERQRIAQELHDEVGQRLTVVLLGIKRALNTAPAEAAEELRLVQDNARTSLEEVRRVARGLRPGVLEDLGLVPALGAMVNELMAQTPLDVRRRFDNELPPLTAEAELVIFRVAQEALTNVTRHANARRVEISLIRRSGAVSLQVSDDGRGIPTDTAGAGIQGMRERAIFVGGTLTVGPGPDGGAEVRLDVPLDRATR